MQPCYCQDLTSLHDFNICSHVQFVGHRSLLIKCWSTYLKDSLLTCVDNAEVCTSFVVATVVPQVSDSYSMTSLI